MATNHREVGIAHVTVVPADAGPEERTDATDDAPTDEPDNDDDAA